jgi:hypothetical protein
MFHPFLTLSPQARSFGERAAISAHFCMRKVTFRAPLLNAVRAAQLEFRNTSALPICIRAPVDGFAFCFHFLTTKFNYEYFIIRISQEVHMFCQE